MKGIERSPEVSRHAVFQAMLKQAGIPRPHAEYRFDASRRWRFDYAWPPRSVALEVEGGIFSRGRHTRGAGYLRDMEKYNAAAIQGWKVVRVTPQQLCTESTIRLVRTAMELGGDRG